MAQKIVEQKKLLSPFIPGSMEAVSRVPQTDWDQDYVTYELKDVVKKTGEGEEDYVIRVKIIEHRDNIAEVVAKDSDSVGVANLMARVLRTGDESLLPQPLAKDGVVNDVTGVPDNLLDADLMAKEAVEAYDSLPDELKKGRSVSDFANTFTAQEFLDFIASKTQKTEEKGENE